MPQEHLDADTLSALSANALTSIERAAAFLHLAECGVCREYLAVFAELKEFRPSGHARKGISIPAKVAAAIAIAALAGWFTSNSHLSARAENQRHPSQIYQQAKLANFSFAGETAVRHKRFTPAGNQIAVMTTLGERWITISGVWDHPQR